MREVLDTWKYRIRHYQKCYSKKAQKQMRWHYCLGLPVVILTTITASSLFADLQKVPEAKYLLGCLCLVSAILTSVQTFYSHAKHAEENKAASEGVSAVRREIEILELFPPKTEKEAKERMERLDIVLQDIAKKAPVVHVEYPCKPLKEGILLSNIARDSEFKN